MSLDPDSSAPEQAGPRGVKSDFNSRSPGPSVAAYRGPGRATFP